MGAPQPAPLDRLNDALAEVQYAPAVARVERRIRRRQKVTMIVCAVTALLAVAWSGWNSIQISRNTASATVNESDIQDLREANRLRLAAGLSPIPLPAPGEEVKPSDIAAAAAAIALNEIRTDTKFQGNPGLPGERGPIGPACLPANPACIGPVGPKGDTGEKGPRGRSVYALWMEPSGEVWVSFDDPAWPPMLVGSLSAGPAGAKGEDGVGVASITGPTNSGTGCSLMVNLTNGTSIPVAVNPAICP